MGLKSMNERAVLIGGELLIETEPGAGTKILLTYPYQSLEV
jgi:signal transduction histidine kinase